MSKPAYNGEKHSMVKFMKTISIICIAVMIAAILLYTLADLAPCLTIAITFGTIAYHFIVRIIVGEIFQKTMNNRADYNKSWYQTRKWEVRLYDFLKVKKWKNKMPTVLPELFDPNIRSWDQIAQASCQSELVHEVNMLISFLPLLAIIPFGSFWAFMITSIVAAFLDSLFVIMQRYNRPRFVRMARRERRTT